MITFVCTAKELIAAVSHPQADRVARKVDDKHVDLLQVELVYIDKYGNIVGDEANDYQPKDGETAVWAIS